MMLKVISSLVCRMARPPVGRRTTAMPSSRQASGLTVFSAR